MWVGNLGGLAEGARDVAVDEAQDRDGAERDGDDSPRQCKRDRDQGLGGLGLGGLEKVPVVGRKSDCDHFGICRGFELVMDEYSRS